MVHCRGGGEVIVTLTCTVGDKTFTDTSIKITVTNPATSISVEYTGETTLEYGASIDKSNFTVKVKYADGTVEDVTEFEVSPTELTTVGESVTLKVTWTDGTTTLTDETVTVTVTNPATDIEVTYTGETTLEYGDKIDTSDFTVKVKYADGTEKAVEDFAVTPETLTDVTIGEVTLTVTCTVDGKEFTDKTVSVTVTNPARSISVEYTGDMEFVYGASIDKSKFAVKVIYADGTEKAVEDFAVTPETLTDVTIGEVTLTVTCTVEGKPFTDESVKVTVTNPAKSISVEYNGAKEFEYGASIDTSDFTVKVIYADGTEKAVEDFTVSPETLTGVTIGEVTLTVTCTVDDQEFTDETVKVTVTNPARSISVEYIGETALTVGDSISNDDFTVTVTYANETEEKVTDFTLSQTKFDELGNFTVTVTYGTLTDTSVQLTVSPSLGYAIANGGTVGSNVTPINDQRGKIDTTGYGEYEDMTMGSVYYDGALYVAAYNNGITGSVEARTYTTIYKIDPDTFTVLDYFMFNNQGKQNGDGAQLFVRNDKMYCIVSSGNVFYIDLNTNTMTESSFELLDDDAKEEIWSDLLGGTSSTSNSTGMTALLAGDHVYLYDSNGIRINEKGEETNFRIAVKDKATELGYSGNLKSITSDEKYIYVQCSSNGQSNIPILVYDWDGNYIGSCAPASASMADGSWSIQSIVAAAGGKMYAAVCSWSNNSGVNIFLWEITFTV